MYDVIIIGAGPAGLSAAIYAVRRNLKTLVVSQDLGGQMAQTLHIENYPGFEEISGLELAEKFKRQAEKFGVEFAFEEVKGIKPKEDGFLVKTNQKELEAKAIILSFGMAPRHLGVPGEEEFKNKGTTYCATCDAPLFKNKTTVVVGGGNAALDAALLLSDIAKKVYLVHCRDEFRADEIMVKRVKENKDIELVLNSEVKEIKGDKLVESVMVKNNKTGEVKEIAVDGVFIEIGNIVKADFIKGLVELNERNQIIIDKNGKTSREGVFAAGDLTDTEYKQIVIAAGEGAKAALEAYKYIKGQGVRTDRGRF